MFILHVCILAAVLLLTSAQDNEAKVRAAEALFSAVHNKDFAYVDWLLSAGVNPDTEPPGDKSKWNALIISVYSGQLDFVDRLLKSGMGVVHCVLIISRICNII